MEDTTKDAPAESYALSASDLLDGGGLVRVEIPELTRDGRVGVLYLRYPKAREVMAYVAAPEAERGPRLIDLTGKMLVHADGTAMFPTADQRKAFQNARGDVFSRLSREVSKLINPQDEETEDASLASTEESGFSSNGGTPRGNALTPPADADIPTGGFVLTDSP